MAVLLIYCPCMAMTARRHIKAAPKHLGRPGMHHLFGASEGRRRLLAGRWRPSDSSDHCLVQHLLMIAVHGVRVLSWLYGGGTGSAGRE
jgi:hypothetical protein